jgi:catechol 2,3-dioxygenase-like lactoylglutathione lyase family enzyme
LVQDPQHPGLNHEYLRTSDVEKSMEWYLDRFGGVRMGIRNVRDAFLYPGDVWPVFAAAEVPSHTETAILHPGWRVPDLQEKVAEVTAGGAVVVDGPRSSTIPDGIVNIAFITAPMSAERFIAAAANDRTRRVTLGVARDS